MGLFEQMSPNEARLAVLAVGALLIALVYLWGNRVRLRASLDERRRRRAQRAAGVPPLAPSTGDQAPVGYADPLAHQRLVDVEIVPLHRVPPAEAPAAAAEAPVAAPAPAPAASAPVVDATAGETIPAAPVEPGARPAAATEAVAAAEAAAAPAPVLEKITAPLTDARAARPPRRPVSPPAPKLETEVDVSWNGFSRSEPAQRPALAAGSTIPPLNLRPAAGSAPAAPGTPVLHIVLTVMADPGARFTGMELLMAAHDLGLKFSKQGLFDGYVNGEVRGKPVFSIANVIEPGVFPPDDVQQLSTPGLLLFMKLPGSVAEPLPSLELMLSQARRLAAKLGGTLCDEQRRRLNPDGIGELRSRVTDFQRRLRQLTPA